MSDKPPPLVPQAGLQTSRARRESTILGLVSESRVLVSARSRKLNRFSDSSRLGREAKTAARTHLGLLFSATTPTVLVAIVTHTHRCSTHILVAHKWPLYCGKRLFWVIQKQSMDTIKDHTRSDHPFNPRRPRRPRRLRQGLLECST